VPEREPQLAVGRERAYGSAVRRSQTAVRNGVPARCTGTSNSRRAPAKYSSSWAAAFSSTASRFSGRSSWGSTSSRAIEREVTASPSPVSSMRPMGLGIRRRKVVELLMRRL